MSWESYLDQLLTKVTPAGTITKVVENAAIIALADGAIWASTPNFGLYGYPVDVPTEDGVSTQPININEIELLLYVVNHDGASNSLAGIRISNEKYFKVNSDPAAGTIYLKKNGGGACIVKNHQTVVFTSWNGNLCTEGAASILQNPGLCNEQAEKLSQYLKDNGF